MTHPGSSRPCPAETVGVILMGGASTRFGSDKAAADLAGQPLLERTYERLLPQCRHVAISVKSEAAAPDGYEIITDAPTAGRGGPLLGVLAALRWAAGQTGVRYLLTSPVDTPLLPTTLGESLLAAMREAQSEAAVAISAGRVHGLSALYETTALRDAERLVALGERKLEAFHLALGSAQAAFPITGGDPFLNINTLQDLARAEHALRAAPKS